VEEEIAEVVREHGWYAANISDHQPPFLYTIGLMQSLNHPEFVMFGLEADNAHALFSQRVRDIRGGRFFAEPGVCTVSIGGDEHRVRNGVLPVHWPHRELEAVQAFWPDDAGKFPFEVGCDLDVYQLQPRLDIGLTPRELRKWRRQWE
jgi:hypothetical protein